jgi:hypothetical protein
MSSQENACSTTAGPPDDHRNAKIVLLPGKVARISPPLRHLGPLIRYMDFVIDGRGAEHTRDPDPVEGGEPCACSAFPAGLAPRFEAALTAAGYRVEVAERRSPERHLTADREYYSRSTGDERAFLRAVRAQPLGQLACRTGDDALSGIDRLFRLFPDARILVVAPDRHAATWYHHQLRPALGRAVGLRAYYDVQIGGRYVVATLSWLETLKGGNWHIVVLLAFGAGKMASEATRRTVLETNASRVYAFVHNDARVQPRTQVRLEAMSGPVIWSARPSVSSRRRRIRT